MSIKKSANDILKQVIFLFVLILLGGFLFIELSGFLTALLTAVIFYVLFRKMMEKLVKKYHWRKSLAAVFIIVITFVIILVPVFLLSYMLYSKIAHVLSDPTPMLSVFSDADAKLKELTGTSLLSDESINGLKDWATKLIPQFLKGLLTALITVLAMYFILFQMLTNYGTLEKKMEAYLPLDKVNTDRLGKELQSITYSNAIGVPFIAFMQSLFAILGFWMFGLNEPIFWGVICGVCSFLPILGTGLIWIPAGCYMIASGYTWQGIAIFIWGSIIIGLVDQVLRNLINKRIADVHPLITIFGAIFGLSVFGLAGLIFGPLLISYFLILIEIYRDEFAVKD